MKCRTEMSSIFLGRPKLHFGPKPALLYHTTATNRGGRRLTRDSSEAHEAGQHYLFQTAASQDSVTRSEESAICPLLHT